MNKYELAATAVKIATEYKTMYIYGGIGGALHQKNKNRAMKREENVKRKKIIDAASLDTFGFDCVGLIKSIIWGWNGDIALNYGGASYASNGLSDVGADKLIRQCCDVSEDFSGIDVGEMVWLSGHCGIYVGDGMVVESTPIWKNGVQLTVCRNLIMDLENMAGRIWISHGKLPVINYDVEQIPERGSHVRVLPDLYSTAGADCYEVIASYGDELILKKS